MSYTIHDAIKHVRETYDESLDKIALNYGSDEFHKIPKWDEMDYTPTNNGCWVNPFDFHIIDRYGLLYPTPYFRIAWGKWKDDEFVFSKYMADFRRL